MVILTKLICFSEDDRDRRLLQEGPRDPPTFSNEKGRPQSSRMTSAREPGRPRGGGQRVGSHLKTLKGTSQARGSQPQGNQTISTQVRPNDSEPRRKTHKCGNCGNGGHNQSTCKQPCGTCAQSGHVRKDCLK